MKLGVCYYPEHWPEERWALDARMMVQAGLSIVRIGEFAWSRLEPAPGQFNFAWLDRAIDTLDEAGLKIVMGTPTATPPRWMIDRHPTMLAVDVDGRPRGFGSRRHYCFSHSGYRDEAVRITEMVAERYGTHHAVIGWQTDNEYGCHDTTISYSEAARRGFRRWLKRSYRDITHLNEAWGNVFWSMEYRSFEEIDLPNLTVTEANPAHSMAFRRYSSDAVRVFNQAQVAVLRRLSPGRDLIHNYMGRVVEFDHFDVGADLDVASWDAYPLGMLEDRVDGDDARKRRFMRQGDPDFQAFHHDLYRAVGRDRWWIMELQPGPVNWAPYNPAPLPGMTRAWALEAMAHGAEAVCWFRWRQAPFAQEQLHAGLLRTDGEPASALGEARDTADAVAVLKQAVGDAGLETGQGDVALLVDYPSLWAWEIQPQGAGFDAFTLLLDAYRALRRRGLSVDIVGHSTASLKGYDLVVAPGLFAWTDPLRRLFATADGPIMLGPRAGARDPEFRIPDGLPPDCDGLLDLKVTLVESLRPESGPGIEGGNGKVQHWREYTEAGDGVETLLEDTDGLSLLLRDGKAHYLAAWPDTVGFDRVLTAILGEPGSTLPDGVRARRLGALRMLVNYSPEEQSIGDVVGDVEWVLGGPSLPPAGVSAYRSAG